MPFQSVGIINANESTQIAATVLIGTRSAFETRRQIWCPGTARSRENANIIRDAEVTDAIVQKHCATTAMKSRNSAHLLPIDPSQIDWTMKRPVSSGPFADGIANVTATSRTKPKITDTTTDMTMPQAAPIEAWRVSSLMCAEASYPVIVYCAIRRPVANTYQNTSCPKLCPEKPVLF